jgi:RNA polymerase sigma-70 factor (ECF subfamily)
MPMVRLKPQGCLVYEVRPQEPDAAQIAQLLAALRPDLLRFASWLARDRSVAEDIVQEALLRAWRSRAALKHLDAARAWLLTIVRREHARRYRRKQLDLVSLDEESDAESIAVLDGPDGELHGLQQAILKLPVEYREPLIMQVLGGFSTAEIARELNLSLTAVLTRLFRARNKLRAAGGGLGSAALAKRPARRRTSLDGGDHT